MEIKKFFCSLSFFSSLLYFFIFPLPVFQTVCNNSGFRININRCTLAYKSLTRSSLIIVFYFINVQWISKRIFNVIKAYTTFF